LGRFDDALHYRVELPAVCHRDSVALCLIDEIA
jgi:hypothetical protein